MKATNTAIFFCFYSFSSEQKIVYFHVTRESNVRKKLFEKRSNIALMNRLNAREESTIRS